MFSFLKRKQPPYNHNMAEKNDCREYIRQTVLFLISESQNIHCEDIQITKNGQAVIILSVPTTDQGKEAEALREKLETEILKITGVEKATIVITTEQAPPKPALKPQSSEKMPAIEQIFAVSSGKGGVGKSTVAVNLALALSAMGKKVGILDADIYGPSIPRLLGVHEKKTEQGKDGRIIPILAHGLKVMSMGFMVGEETPMIWRGPMAQSALLQMVRDVDWDGLDVLVIDMPPGTGDIHLTLAQRVPLSGGVVVSTPQDIALIDARKGLEMFRKVAVPIVGIVENMSYYCCPECGHRDNIFGNGGAKKEAEKLGVPFLGEIPLHSKIREMSDAGTPVTVSDPASAQAKSFTEIAKNILSGLGKSQRPAPRISME